MLPLFFAYYAYLLVQVQFQPLHKYSSKCDEVAHGLNDHLVIFCDKPSCQAVNLSCRPGFTQCDWSFRISINTFQTKMPAVVLRNLSNNTYGTTTLLFKISFKFSIVGNRTMRVIYNEQFIIVIWVFCEIRSNTF